MFGMVPRARYLRSAETRVLSSGAMRRLGVALSLLVVTASAPSASPATPRFTPPNWLLTAERALLDRAFEHAQPIQVHYIPYPKKIAVVFEFRDVVICGMCSSPTAATQPRGKVLRVSFDRRTHLLSGAADGWAIRFCEVRAGRPPKSTCLHR
jgi:hypothetical protein